MTPFETKKLQALTREVGPAIDEARDRFGFRFCDPNNTEVGFAVLLEELGKLVRAHNKLHIATDPSIRQEWVKIAHEKFVTTRAVLDRLYLFTEQGDLPQHHD